MTNLGFFMGRSTSKSKIVPISRFTTMSRLSSDFISGTYGSEISVLNKGATGKKSAKSQPWLVKKQKDTQKLSADQRLNCAIKNRCEVFSAWQYESFLGDGHTQPKYYLVQEPGEIDSIATKFVTGYTSFNLMMSRNTADATTVLSQPKNLKLFAQMLINYLWLAASDFKLDHIGIDSEGNLVCLDFGESLIPFQYADTAYLSRGWNFSITPEDLLTAPFFTTYKSSNFFVERATASFPGVFDFLHGNPGLRQQLCMAILKRCIFPNFISFAALELFSNFEECAIDLQEFMTKRTAELRSAAIQNPIFLEFMKSHGEKAYKEIKADLLDGDLINSRYFRNAPEKYKTTCLDELHFNFENLVMEAKLTTFQGENFEAVTMLRKLRQFCEAQYLRLKKVNETAFFKKGLSDKTILFKRLLNNIDATPFAELTPGAWATVIEQLIKETAIVAHHRRYSKINTFFRHTESTSWKDFTAFFSGYTGEYSSTVQAVLTAKSGRATVISEGVTVSGYNDYRNAVKSP